MPWLGGDVATATRRSFRPPIQGGPITMTGIAFNHEPRQDLGTPKSGNWVLEGSDRGGQDKSRKVRPVGRSGNASKFNHTRNIAKTRHNLPFLLARGFCSVFVTLGRIR